jgi:dienelactone hydrolase
MIMPNHRKLLIFLYLAIIIFISTQSQAAELISLNTRPGVSQTFIYIKSDKPSASIILFAGGHGNLKLSTSSGMPSIGLGKNNFLVRTRNKFANNDFAVAVVDAPSDKKGKEGMKEGFRNSKEHVIDIDKVIAYLREENNIPVWLIGTSRGTESATRVAISSAEKPDGLILTSSMTRPNKGGKSVTEMELYKIKIPTLIVAHLNDKCKQTPPDGAEAIKNSLLDAKRIEVKYFSGGEIPKSDPCKALSEHGFFGIEDDVINAIAKFIKN